MISNAVEFCIGGMHLSRVEYCMGGMHLTIH